jgi:CheY-like chemotaxis protein
MVVIFCLDAATGQRVPARRNTINTLPMPTQLRERSDAAPSENLRPARAPAPPAAMFRPGTRVVVAEDDRVSQAVLTLILQKLGLEVHVAFNGLRALELIRLTQPALVMMDMQMPVMDGAEAIRLLREDREGPQPAVVVVSANGISDRHRCDLGALGVDDFLLKPVNRAQLLASLTRLLPQA